MRLSKVAGALLIILALAVAIWTTVSSGVQYDLGLRLAVVGMAIIGGVIAIRRPGNRMAWLLGGIGLAGCLAALTPPDNEAGRVIPFLLGGVAWFWFLYVTLGLLPLLFPTGRALSRRWSFFGWLGSASIAIFSVLWLVQDQVCQVSDDGGCTRWIDNPIGVAGVANPEDSALGVVLVVGLLISVIGSVASLVVRYRRAEPMERRQIKWLLFAVSLITTWVLVVDTIGPLFGLAVPEQVYDFVIGLLWLALPAAAGIAILKYRLFDIDRIVSRTVTYGLVVGVLAAAYFGAVGFLTQMSPLDSNLAVAASTLGVAALFNPLRRRVQKTVEHRFNRARYDADQVVAELSTRLRAVTDIDGVLVAGMTAAAQTVQPTTTSLWIRNAQRQP